MWGLVKCHHMGQSFCDWPIKMLYHLGKSLWLANQSQLYSLIHPFGERSKFDPKGSINGYLAIQIRFHIIWAIIRFFLGDFFLSSTEKYDFHWYSNEK